MPTKPIRKERTLSVKDVDMTQDEMLHLASLAVDPRYDTLLNVIERACITQDTALINTPAHDEVKVLAEHKFSKAFWLIFTYLQKQVQNAYNQSMKTDEPASEDPSDEEFLQGVQ